MCTNLLTVQTTTEVVLCSKTMEIGPHLVDTYSEHISLAETIEKSVS